MMSADAIYEGILRDLKAGRFDRALPATEHFLEVENRSQRSLEIRAIALLHSGMHHEAAATLRACIAEFGETGSCLTNLAKTQSLNGNAEQSIATLRRALTLDPNQNGALMWYAAICRDAEGQAGYANALKEIDALPNSWRAGLWFAREDLNRGFVEVAVRHYERALASAYDSDALMMISGDLGARSYPDEAIRLVAPRYLPSQHGEKVGLNLLNAYFDAKRKLEGLTLLEQMHQTFGSILEPHTQKFRQLFSGLP